MESGINQLKVKETQRKDEEQQFTVPVIWIKLNDPIKYKVRPTTLYKK